MTEKRPLARFTTRRGTPDEIVISLMEDNCGNVTVLANDAPILFFSCGNRFVLTANHVPKCLGFDLDQKTNSVMVDPFCD